jgi:hypothetical protein
VGRNLFLILALQQLVVILFVVVVGRFALEASQCQSVLVENARGLEIVDEFVVLLEGTRHLLPVDELGDLFGELPELLEVDVSVWQSAKSWSGESENAG